MATLPALVKEFLAQKTIAIVGGSGSAGDGLQLKYKKFKVAGYRVYPVNPHLTTYDGGPCYPDLKSLPERPDAVFILAKPSVKEAIVQQCASLGIRRVWMHCMMGDKTWAGGEDDECVGARRGDVPRIRHHGNARLLVPGADSGVPTPFTELCAGLWGLLGFLRIEHARA